MNIVIIGSGNIATIFAKKLSDAKHNIVQVLSRNIEHAKILASQHNSAFGDYETAVDTTADLYLFAVTDSALFDMKKHFSLNNKLVAHTAGSVPIDILNEISSKYGVLYPLQSLKKEMPVIPAFPVLVDANTEETFAQLQAVAHDLSDKVERANDDQRAKFHTAAVVVSNFINHLYILTMDFCETENLDFNVLQPLIEETALRLRRDSPKNLQTGPAIRSDLTTLQKNLQVLSAHPKLKYLYIKLTDSIMNQ
jgi:predicted short-subunit dehydrogenase-like oxidoreductase (DUF2520 family)